MEIKIETPAVVTVKAGDAKVSLDVTDLHEDALAQVFAYGLGRFYQDRTNSWAHARAKDPETGKKDETLAPTDSDKREYLIGLIEQHKAGAIASRGAGGGSALTDVDKEALKLASADVLAAMKVTKWAEAVDHAANKESGTGEPYFIRAGKGGKTYIRQNWTAFESFINRMDDKVRALSGGQVRRAEIAGALLHGPRLLLADEATAGLDIGVRAALVDDIHRLASEEGVGVLWATHLADEIQPDDRVIVLHKGRVIASGTAAGIAGDKTLAEAFLALTGAEAPA